MKNSKRRRAELLHVTEAIKHRESVSVFQNVGPIVHPG